MPDLNDQTLGESNPLYDPLAPSVENIQDYAQELEKEMALLMKPIKGEISEYAWYDVTKELPASFLITANRIGEVLGFPAEKKKITLPSHLRERLENAAFNEGVSVEEKIEQWLNADEGIEPEEEQLTEEEIEEKEQKWHQDMQELVKEHDNQLWLLTAIAKMIQPLKEKVSQFSWLKNCSRNQLRYQT